jgi:hypothetical protein
LRRVSLRATSETCSRTARSACPESSADKMVLAPVPSQHPASSPRPLQGGPHRRDATNEGWARAISGRRTAAGRRGTGSSMTQRWRKQIPGKYREFCSSGPPGAPVGSQSNKQFNGLRCNSLRTGTGNLFWPNRELNRHIREFIRMIRES